MNKYLEEALIRLSRLLRSRVIVCMVGLYAINKEPSAAQWIAIVCGMAIGISGVEEWVRGKQPRDDVK